MSRSTFITIDSPKYPANLSEMSDYNKKHRTMCMVTVKSMDDDGIGTFHGDISEYWADMMHNDLQRIVRKFRKLMMDQTQANAT